MPDALNDLETVLDCETCPEQALPDDGYKDIEPVRDSVTDSEFVGYGALEWAVG